jgi:hypothetical protein
MCYYEDEIWQSRYHDPVIDYTPPEQPKKPELSDEEFLKRLSEAQKRCNCRHIDVLF